MDKIGTMTVRGIVILGALVWAAGCGGEADQQAQVIRPVRQHVVGFAGGEVQRTFSGTAESGRIVNLSFRSGGVITQFDARVGQRVRRRQRLAQLDNVAARLAYEQAVSALNSAASQMNTAQLALDRVRALYEKGSASLSDYEAAKNSFRTAEASHESAERSVQIQEEQIRYGYIFVPEDGTIAAVNAEVNENVSAGQTVAVLNAGGGMEIALGVPESLINRVRAGLEVSVTFTALPDAGFSGVVTEIAPSVDPGTATYPVRIAVQNPTDEIRTGMAANVTFDFGQEAVSSDRTLVVPVAAVGEDPDGRFVFLIEDQGAGIGSVRKTHITVGPLTAEGFVVHQGLSAGQAVATAGLQTLLDGQQVRVQ